MLNTKHYKILAAESNVSADTSFYNRCFEYCPQECEYTEYKLRSFTSVFPSDEYAKLVLKQYNVNKSERNKISSIEELKKSVISLNIYFDCKEYTEIKERPLTTFDVLLANLGGQLGLFLGLDVLSLVELFEFVFVANLFAFRKK